MFFSFIRTIFGFEKATKEEIDKAVKKAIKKYHPDKYSDPQAKELANEILKVIYEAADTLQNAKKRAIYDKFGHHGLKIVKDNDLESEEFWEELSERRDELKGVDFPKGGELKLTLNLPEKSISNFSMFHNFHTTIAKDKAINFGGSTGGSTRSSYFALYSDYYQSVDSSVLIFGCFLSDFMPGIRISATHPLKDS